MARLTQKQKRFVDEYLIDLNATQAAIRAGYSSKTAYSIGEENLRKPDIRAYLDKAMADLSKRTGVNQEIVIRELARVAFVNPEDVIDFDTVTIRPEASRDDTAAIAALKVRVIQTPNGEGIEREIRMCDKLKALELLGKHFGMFTSNVNVTASLGVQIIDDI